MSCDHCLDHMDSKSVLKELVSHIKHAIKMRSILKSCCSILRHIMYFLGMRHFMCVLITYNFVWTA